VESGSNTEQCGPLVCVGVRTIVLLLCALLHAFQVRALSMYRLAGIWELKHGFRIPRPPNSFSSSVALLLLLPLLLYPSGSGNR